MKEEIYLVKRYYFKMLKKLALSPGPRACDLSVTEKNNENLEAAEVPISTKPQQGRQSVANQNQSPPVLSMHERLATTYFDHQLHIVSKVFLKSLISRQTLADRSAPTDFMNALALKSLVSGLQLIGDRSHTGCSASFKCRQ